MLSGQWSIGRLDEDQLAFPDGDPVARLDGPEVPRLVVVARRCSPCPAWRRRARRWGMLHDEGKPARVIGLGVVGNDDVDLRRVDDGPDVLEQLLPEGAPDGVDQGGLLVQDEIGVVGGAPVGRQLVAVELPQAPVHDPHPVDIFHQLRDHSKPPDSEAFYLFLMIHFTPLPRQNKGAKRPARFLQLCQ